jgi:acyl-CoA-binding protein
VSSIRTPLKDTVSDHVAFFARQIRQRFSQFLELLRKISNQHPTLNIFDTNSLNLNQQAMDRSELERQSNAPAGRLSSEGIPSAGPEYITHELNELKDQVCGPEYLLDSKKAPMPPCNQPAKTAERRERSRDVVARTQNSNAPAGRLSSEGIPSAGPEYITHELNELKDQVCGPEYILDSKKAPIPQCNQPAKAAEMREGSRDVVAGDQSEDYSHWSVDDKVVCHPNNDEVLKLRKSLLRQSSAGLSRTTQPGAVAVPGIKFQGNPRYERKGRGNRATKPGAVAVAGVFTGPMNGTAKQQTDTPTLKDAPSPSSAFASAPESSHPPELQGNRQQELERRELKANNEEGGASSNEEMKPGAVAVAGVFTGSTSPSFLGEPRGPSAKEPSLIIAEQSLIIAELAEPFKEDEELRRRNQ